MPLECIGDNALNQYLLWVGSGWAGDRKDGILPGGSDVEVLLLKGMERMQTGKWVGREHRSLEEMVCVRTHRQEKG